MLPNTAIVTLNEKISRFFSQVVGGRLLLPDRSRGPRVLSLPTDASSDFFICRIFLVIFIFHGLFDHWVLFFAVSPAAARCELLCW